MIIYSSLKDYVLPSANHLLVDVRSLSDFRHSPIPSAVHLHCSFTENAHQLFIHQKPNGKAPSLFFKNYTDLLSQIKQLPTSKQQVIFFCENGAWKSRLVHHFLQSAVSDSRFLQGGYAGFIKHQSVFFSEKRIFYLLAGKTGSGKTKVLRALRQKGAQVLDLETLAQHRGSVFGKLTGQSQQSSPQFHNKLLNRLLEIPNHVPLFVEQKGRLIGRCTIPSELLNQFSTAKTILLDTPMPQRIKNILGDYQDLDETYIQRALEKLKPRMGEEIFHQCQVALSRKDSNTFVKHLVNYYDSVANYQHSFPQLHLRVNCSERTFEDIATEIIQHC